MNGGIWRKKAEFDLCLRSRVNFFGRARVQMALFYIYDASFPFILKGVGGVKMWMLHDVCASELLLCNLEHVSLFKKRHHSYFWLGVLSFSTAAIHQQMRWCEPFVQLLCDQIKIISMCSGYIQETHLHSWLRCTFKRLFISSKDQRNCHLFMRATLNVPLLLKFNFAFNMVISLVNH